MEETFSAADGRPVVATDTAEDIGEVKSFVLDPSARHIEAVQVSGRGRKGDVLAWRDVATFGADAVMARRAEATEQVKGTLRMRESRVLNTDGFEQGTVTDVVFDSESGAVISVRTQHGDIPAERLIALGSYALIIQPGEDE